MIPMRPFHSRFLAVLAGTLFAAAQAAALGADTNAGTDISNTATVDYVVGTVNQPDVNSNTATFEVDRKRPPDRRRGRRRLHGRGARRCRAGAHVHGHQRHQRAGRLPARRQPGRHRDHGGSRRHGRLRCGHPRGDHRFERQRQLRGGRRHGILPRRSSRRRDAHGVHRIDDPDSPAQRRHRGSHAHGARGPGRRRRDARRRPRRER